MERNAEKGQEMEAAEIGLLKYLFSVHLILFGTLPSGMYVIRFIAVTNGKERNRTKCFIYIAAQRTHERKCVSRQ
jgi:hypothetical protein